MTPTPTTTETPDIDAIRADAERHVSELRDQRQRCAPEALVDDEAAEELRAVEAELADAERALELSALGEVEVARRGQEAEGEVQEKARQAAQTEADKLERIIAGDERALDEKLAAFAAALRVYADHCSAREGALIRAGNGGDSRTIPYARASTLRVEGALQHYLHEQGVASLITTAAFLGDSIRPLAAPDSAFQPKEK
jgi:hypothetical protein